MSNTQSKISALLFSARAPLLRRRKAGAARLDAAELVQELVAVLQALQVILDQVLQPAALQDLAQLRPAARRVERALALWCRERALHSAQN